MENIRRLINLKVNMVKDLIIRSFRNVVDKFKRCASMEQSLGHLMEVARDFYVFSIGINEIEEGIKNRKRFKMLILNLIYTLIFTLAVILFSVSNYLYCLLKVDFLPGNFRIILIAASCAFTWILAIKFDMIFAEIQLNLSPLKVFYFLINNIKSKHKLTDLNYNRLAILSLISQLVIADFGCPIPVSNAIGLTVLTGILSRKLIWILLSICFIPYCQLASAAFSTWMSMALNLFAYYKMRFDQIHLAIKSNLQNGKCNIINKRIKKQLINLIDEHKRISNEVHKLNLMLRRSAGFMSITMSTVRIIVLFLVINYKNNIFVNIMLSSVFIILFVFGFGMTYLFSCQITSAHQSQKLIYSILSCCKMRLQFKFKVILKF